MMDQFGISENDLMTWTTFNNAVNTFDTKVIKIDDKKSTTCPECGERPPNVCFDGVCIGIAVDKLENNTMEEFDLLQDSPKVLMSPLFKDRMFVKKKANRDLVRELTMEEPFLQSSGLLEDDDGFKVIIKRYKVYLIKTKQKMVSPFLRHIFVINLTHCMWRFL